MNDQNSLWYVLVAALAAIIGGAIPQLVALRGARQERLDNQKAQKDEREEAYQRDRWSALHVLLIELLTNRAIIDVADYYLLMKTTDPSHAIDIVPSLPFSDSGYLQAQPYLGSLPVDVRRSVAIAYSHVTAYLHAVKMYAAFPHDEQELIDLPYLGPEMTKAFDEACQRLNAYLDGTGSSIHV